MPKFKAHLVDSNGKAIAAFWLDSPLSILIHEGEDWKQIGKEPYGELFTDLYYFRVSDPELTLADNFHVGEE